VSRDLAAPEAWGLAERAKARIGVCHDLSRFAGQLLYDSDLAVLLDERFPRQGTRGRP
jgi:hypothetical protein